MKLKNWNDYLIVINKLLHILNIIMLFFNKQFASKIKPLIGKIELFPIKNQKFIQYILHYPLSDSFEKINEEESNIIINSLIS